jgi:hypothetical protein
MCSFTGLRSSILYQRTKAAAYWNNTHPHVIRCCPVFMAQEKFSTISGSGNSTNCTLKCNAVLLMMTFINTVVKLWFNDPWPCLHMVWQAPAWAKDCNAIARTSFQLKMLKCAVTCLHWSAYECECLERRWFICKAKSLESHLANMIVSHCCVEVDSPHVTVDHFMFCGRQQWALIQGSIKSLQDCNA